MNTFRLALFENRTQAERAQQCLTQAGIRAEIHAESSLVRLWFVSRWRAGARVEVPLAQAPQAVQLLQVWEGNERQTAVRCPECRSFRVDFPQFTEKSILTNLLMGLVAELRLIERQYYCADCHCMWTRPGGQPMRRRQHLAPDYFLEDLSDRMLVNDAESNTDRAVGRDGPRAEASATAEHFPAAPPGHWLRRRITFAILLAGATLILCGHSELRGSDLSTRRLAVHPDRNSAAFIKTPTYLGDVLPILMGKCARCHNDQTAVLANWLDYGTAANKRWEIKRRVWDSWHGSYFKQSMPTANGPESVAITEEERQMIRDWVEAGAPRGVAPVYTGGSSKSEKIEYGRRLFTTICAACHQPTGLGIPGRFPPLAGSDLLNGDKHRAIHIVLNGLQGDVVVNGQHFNNAMPRFPLTDRDIASALTFVYNSFGNSGKEVTPEEVGVVRNEKEEPGTGLSSVTKVPEEKSPYE